MGELSPIFTTFGGVMCKGTCSNSDSELTFWPIAWVGESYNQKTVAHYAGVSGSILYMLA